VVSDRLGSVNDRFDESGYVDNPASIVIDDLHESHHSSDMPSLKAVYMTVRAYMKLSELRPMVK
jgi:hypothetical protein